MAQFVFTMHQVGKVVPPKREILKDISLSFFPGAKIGVLGLNGSGKSTLLRIMAGVDKEFNGEARPEAGLKIGYLPQEPLLDEHEDVRGNVQKVVGETLALIEEFNAISERFAEPLSEEEMNSKPGSPPPKTRISSCRAATGRACRLTGLSRIPGRTWRSIA